MTKLAFPIEMMADDDGSLLVTCPLLPEVTTFGTDRDDALAHAADAIEEALAARIARGEDIPLAGATGPTDTTPRLPVLTVLKVLLYLACRLQGVSRAELCRRLGWHREQVDRLFRLDHATRTDQLDAAFRAIGKDVSIDLRNAA